MDNLDIKNLQLSYQAVYDDVLCESMEELGIIGEIDEAREPGVKPYRPNPTQAEVRADAAKARRRQVEAGKTQRGYGDKVGSSPELTRRPDKETAEWLRRTKSPYGKRITGEMGREWGSRQAAGVTRVVRGPGEPQAVTLPREKKKPKMVKKDGKWVKEALDYYDIILSHLLEDRISELQDTIRKRKASGATRRELSNLRNELQGRQRIKKGHKTWVKGGQPPQNQQEQADIYDIILSHLLDEGYAETVENAEAIMVSMSEEWVSSIVNG